LEVGATPPTEIASEPSKITLAIKLNELILPPCGGVCQEY
jgi:hypothetical protein